MNGNSTAEDEELEEGSKAKEAEQHLFHPTKNQRKANRQGQPGENTDVFFKLFLLRFQVPLLAPWGILQQEVTKEVTSITPGN